MSKMLSLLCTELWAQIILAMFLGIGLGLLLAPSGGAMLPEEVAGKVGQWVALPGSIFLALIQMVVIPLVTASIVLGIASQPDAKLLKKIGVRIAPYFVATTFVAVIIGASLAYLIEPGAYIDAAFLQGMMSAQPEAMPPLVGEAAGPQPSVPERIAALIPTNPVKSELERDMLAIVISAIFTGVALVTLPRERAKPLLDVLSAIQDVSMRIVEWAMKIAPLAVFGLLCDITIRVGLDAIFGMSVYVGTVILGLLLLLSFYLVLAKVFGGKAPIEFLRAIREAQLLAFSTSSSAAVMPLSIRTAQERLGVPAGISKFVVPLGATINMDGTALYQVVAAVFLVQVFGVELTTAGLFILIATTVGASIGSPSTPGVGIVILATILQNIGVPVSGIALIIGVDRILDMSRTAVNVTGDLTACVVLNKWIGAEVPDYTSEPATTLKAA